MNKKFISWLSFLAVFTLIVHSCRNDQFSEQETYNNTGKFNLTSKTISLNESKHKAKLVSELGKAETKLKSIKTDAFGKVASYGNGVSIDTDDVIYIENGPNYHTYTFRIIRSNTPADAPVENLLLTPLPDGSYREFLVTYTFTPLEKQKFLSGIGVDTNGKVAITELEKGTYNGSGQLAKSSCGYKSTTVWVDCCHNGYHNSSNVDDWVNCVCPPGGQPKVYTVVSYICGPADPVITPEAGGSSGGGGGEGGGTATPDPPCDTSTIPTNPQPGFTDPNGCPIGTPTLPNLGSIDNDPCFKTKTSITKANNVLHTPEVQQKMDAVLKGKVNETNEWGVALGQKPDGSYEVTNPAEGTPSSATPPLNQLSNPSSAVATGHSHAGAFGNPSGGDMFSILENMLNFPNLRYSYVYGIAPNGVKETYALVVNDKALAEAFLSAYPKIKNYDINTHDINDRTELGKEFDIMKNMYAYDKSGNTSGEYYDKGAVAMAHVLEKFNSGMSIAKADAIGNLKKINASIQIMANGEEKPIVSKCP